MNAALVLVDLQHDFLTRRPLDPAPELLVARAASLLAYCRGQGFPVVHVRMTITREPDNRLPHWKTQGRWMCVTGTHGHAFPGALEPHEGETVVDKAGFSAFEDGRLEALLEAAEIDTVLLAGVYGHNCIRATAVDAWRSGRAVVIVEDAIGSCDPLDAEATGVFLRDRGIRFVPVRSVPALLGASPSEEARLLSGCTRLPALLTAGATAAGNGPLQSHRSPADPDRILWASASAGPKEVAEAVDRARAAQRHVRTASIGDRCRWLESLARVLSDEETTARLARWIAMDVGKPIREARAEIARGVKLLVAAGRPDDDAAVRTFADGSRVRRVPLGTIAAVTPWNHPLAMVLGKLAPAVRHGNTVVWKPAPAGNRLAVALFDLIRTAGWPADAMTLVLGGESTARLVMNAPGIDAITLTGGPAAGMAAQRIAALRHVPLQAELGGNNAAIVWQDADPVATAHQIAPAAFGFAGQRCTANRRVVVVRSHLDAFLESLVAATRNLPWGDPLDEATVVGPMISEESRERVAISLAGAARNGHAVLTPHAGAGAAPARGWYLPPAIVVCGDPQAEVVQRESFGPVLVVQPSDSWDEAIELANGVNQGLVASVFTGSVERWRDFQDRAQAGIVKWNRATAEAGVESPFGGWKASGIGPPEHGPAHLDFYTRSQTLYDA